MRDTASNNELILYATLGGLQPGGTCLSWVAGLTACEALRLTQRFNENTSKSRRFFAYFGLVMTISMACILAIVLYHYSVESYGDYQNLTYLTDVSRIHQFLCKISSLGGIIFYSQLLWLSDLGKFKALKIPIVKIIILMILLIATAMYIFSTIRMFTSKSMRSATEHWQLMSWGPYVQLFCEVLLTLFKGCDLAKSDTIRQALVYKNHPLPYASSLLCLLCQTAVFPTIFDLILICLPDGHSPGIRYTLLALSAELHIFGPIMAISAALDSDCLNEPSSNCSVARHEYYGDNPQVMKRLTFQ